ncbi:hypothetical protein [Glycomyces paridis]|nr:hypothetical protein [Glycomyces paridis]
MRHPSMRIDCPTTFEAEIPSPEAGPSSSHAICDECGETVWVQVLPARPPRTWKGRTAIAVLATAALGMFIGAIARISTWTDENIDAPPSMSANRAGAIDALFSDGASAALFLGFVILLIALMATASRGAALQPHPDYIGRHGLSEVKRQEHRAAE